MTMITYHESTRSHSPHSALALLVSKAAAPILKLRDAWRRRQTERFLEGLDPEIRKDIGWPTTDVISDRR